MKTFTKTELEEILKKHKMWLNNEDSGERADLRYADLRSADLRSADLRSADLRYADLRSAGLRSADLRYADLRYADLRSAGLRSADLRSADLRSAGLRSADLRYADLRSADLRSADLRSADLRSADLRSAGLRSADLRSADLRSADLRSADLRSAKNIPNIPYACPDYGSFIGYKKASGYIVELEILSDAQRLSAVGRKCRCDKAKVLSIQTIDGSIANITEVASDRDTNFIYKVGEIVEVKDFDPNRWNECSTGIHFFINKQEAIDYKS